MEIINEHNMPYRFGNKGAKYLFRGPHYEWGIILVKAGEKMAPHLHEQVEEQFYFEVGTPQLVVNGEAHRVAEGDVFRLEPGEAHDIINDTADDVRIIFIKAPFLPDDKVDVQ